jgi:hypothetical protein
VGSRLHSKEQICNVLLASQRSVLELSQRVPSSSDLSAYVDGYLTALSVIAQGLGIEFSVERPDVPQIRVWQEYSGLLASAEELVSSGDNE